MVLRGCDLGIEHCEVLVVAHLSHLVSEEIGESRARYTRAEDNRDIGFARERGKVPTSTRAPIPEAPSD